MLWIIVALLAALAPADLTLTATPSAPGMVDVLLSSRETGDAVLTLTGVPPLAPPLAISEGGGCRTRPAETICEWPAGGPQPRTVLVRIGENATLRARLAIWRGPEATRAYPASAAPPPAITTYGCAAAVCALVRHADTITSDAAYTEDEPPPESGARLLIFASVPTWIEARGAGGTVRWPEMAPTPLPTRPVPTATPPPFVVRAHLGVVLDGVGVP